MTSTEIIKDFEKSLDNEDHLESFFTILGDHISAFIPHKYKVYYDYNNTKGVNQSTYYLDQDFHIIDDHRKVFERIDNIIYKAEFDIQLDENTINTILDFSQSLINLNEKSIRVLCYAYLILKRLYFSQAKFKERINGILSKLLFNIYSFSEDVEFR